MRCIYFLLGLLIFKINKVINKSLSIYKTHLVKGNHGIISGSVSLGNPKNIILGNNTYINGGSYLHAGLNSKIIIGDDCLISYNVHMRTITHIFNDFEKKINTQGHEESNIIIGNNVWIGYGAQILQGINIGDNVIVGAGAVVTKDIPNNAIVGGVPATIIRYRK